MCLRIACSAVSPAVIATDRRHSKYHSVVGTLRYDYGGKLVRLGRGWIAVAGEGRRAAISIERLAEAGVDAADIPAVSACLADGASSMAVAIAERWPEASDPSKHTSDLLLASGDTVACVGSDGEILNQGPGLLLASYPYHDRARSCSEYADLKTAVSQTIGHWELVRAIAREFARVARESDAVSSAIEVGVGSRFLSGDSAQLTQATDKELSLALRSAPPYRPGILIRAIEERITI